MITIENILEKNQIKSIKDLIDYEVENYLCKEVPLYQSYNNMHIKYKDIQLLSFLFNTMLKETEIATNEKLNIAESWFNICKEDSKFEFHNHKEKYITCVYFLENCEENGPLFKINNSCLQLLCKDNSLAIFDPEIMHSIPEWKGKNRYTVAMDFVKKEV
tara:strand:+ start:400 stop:879 length:480 start_codon:yes stop_codon:yes gene_type:complete